MTLKKILGDIKFEIPFYITLLFLTIGYLLIFSSTGTPIRPDYQTDATIFMILGKLLIEGQIPYIDFFDHKGPSLIFLEGFGQIFFEYRAGLFFVECICMFISLIFIYKTARLKLDRFTSLSACLFFLIVIKYIFSGGNSNEELSFFPNFISIYLFCGYFLNKETITAKRAFVIGLCFSFIFWLRPNNAAPICAVSAALFIFYLIDKDFRALKRFVFYFLLGQLPFTLFYILFFLYHGAVYDLFYGTFLFNIAYTKSQLTFNHAFNPWNFFLIGILLIGMIAYYIRYKDYKVFIVSILMLAGSIISANIGHAHGHYFLNYAPVLVFAFILILVSINNQKILKAIDIIILLFFFRIFIYGTESIFFRKEDMERRVEERKVLYEGLLSNIPQTELNNVFFYEVFVEIYPVMDITPNYKYFALQEWMAESNPTIFDEINEMVLHKSPKWIMLTMHYKTEDGEKDLSKFKNQELIKILDKNYERYAEEGPHLLFKHKDK